MNHQSNQHSHPGEYDTPMPQEQNQTSNSPIEIKNYLIIERIKEDPDCITSLNRFKTRFASELNTERETQSTNISFTLVNDYEKKWARKPKHTSRIKKN